MPTMPSARATLARFSRFLVLGLLLAAPARVLAGLRDDLALFTDLAPGDTILSLIHHSGGGLSARVRDTATKAERVVGIKAAGPVADKLLDRARVEGVTVELSAEPAGAEAQAAAEAGPKPAQSQGAQRRNRISYVVGQTFFSTYLYGGALPYSLDITGRPAAAIALLSLPGSFAAHFYFAHDKPFEDAELYGASYLSFAALAGSYLAAFATVGPREPAFRTANFLAMLAYPAGIWAGYHYGENRLDNPGRILLESDFATTGALFGYVLPLIYLPYHAGVSSEFAVRLVTGEALAAGAAGHYLSRYYRPGEVVPQGIATGVATHTWLGLAVGASALSWMKSDDLRLNLGLGVASAAAGMAEGLWFFRDRQDTWERGLYNVLGAGSGALVTAAIFTLTGYPDQPGPVVSAYTAGAIGGYAIADYFTRDLVEKAAKLGLSSPAAGRLALNPMPVPEATLERGSQVALRLRVPGLTWRFD